MFERYIVKPFVLWIVLFSAAAVFEPRAFIWFRGYISPGLAVIMLGMGMILSLDDFRRIKTRLRAVMIGVGAQFLIMPGAAFVLASLFHLDPSLSAGMIVVGSCPGGTASNVIAYLADADVALSVTLTSITTILSVVLTPFFIWLLAGTFVEIDAAAILLTIAQIIIGPIAVGIVLKKYLPAVADQCIPFFPSISVVTIVLIVAAIIGLNRDALFSSGGLVIAAVALHNLAGYGLGYGISKIARLSEKESRTIAIEVGMQNSGLGVALAVKHFTDSMVALPPAIFSAWHNISGPALAGVFRKYNKKAD